MAYCTIHGAHDQGICYACHGREHVRQARETVQHREGDLTEARDKLARELATAQDAGASIAQLMEWTGYSRRQVFNVLGSARR